ncbi:MAG: tyrosine--tRNA ligase [Bacteroidota bacterium]|nr:tyrosine--tRNA ligase [Bacteroidota bacterium]
MSFLEELEWRNMLHDSTPGIRTLLSEGMQTAYIGFDPTAPSLGLGNYVQIMLLQLFQQSGHRPIILMGGATGRIGDPSGKDKERELKTEEELDGNIQKQEQQFRRLINFEQGENAAMLVNNYDFYKNMNILEFLRKVGKNASINTMLAKESVKRRLETGISYTEFSYQLLQAYDFYCLYNTYQCKIQMGGSDQWGNIVAGTDYIGKNITGAQSFAITSPLLTKSDGKKFGKSEEGNIWLDPEMTSPYKFYQFWLNVDDADLSKLIRFFTFKTKEEVCDIEETYKNNPQQLKKILAEEITSRIHGQVSYQNVLHVTEILFSKDFNETSLSNMSEEVLIALSKEIPNFKVAKSEINQGLSIQNLLSEKTAIFPSKSEARRAIQGNAIHVNKIKMSDPEFIINSFHILAGKFIMIENGKKNKYMIELI